MTRVHEDILSRIKEMDKLLTESVLLTESAKNSFKEHAGKVRSNDELMEFYTILVRQKKFVIGYLKDSLHSEFLKNSVYTVVQEMKHAYRVKLSQDEELHRKSEVLAFLNEFEAMEF